jgi:hypothetical protein
MKVTKVHLLPNAPAIKIEAISCGKEVVIEGASIADVAKKAMKIDHYFSRDTEIIEDIKRVLLEEERDNPKEVLAQAA